jgi:Cu2+-exporting ATPase
VGFGGTAKVNYDESVTDLMAIKAKVRECGLHCAGEVVPRHVCLPEDPPAGAIAAPAVPLPHEHATYAPHAREPAQAEAIAHEIGHGAGMDLEAMARDMRNRFWIVLVFAVPIFIYSPMGGMFTPPAIRPADAPSTRWLAARPWRPNETPPRAYPP